jgi:hypothetical protein
MTQVNSIDHVRLVCLLTAAVRAVHRAHNCVPDESARLARTVVVCIMFTLGPAGGVRLVCIKDTHTYTTKCARGRYSIYASMATAQMSI